MIGTGTNRTMNGMSSLSFVDRPRSRSSSHDVSPQQDVPPPHSTFVIPPWTPWSPNPPAHASTEEDMIHRNSSRSNNDDDGWNNGMLDDDDESVPSKPPSPYSPPPASLFSTDEVFPPKSIRRPDYHSMMMTMTSNENSVHHPNINIPSDEKKRPSSQVLPTVWQLQQQYQESLATRHLLQQENQALVAACDQLQQKWEDDTQQWRQQVQDLRQLQEQALGHERAVARERTESLQVQVQLLQDQIQTLTETLAAKTTTEQQQQIQLQQQFTEQLLQRDDTIRILQDQVQTLQTSRDAQQEEELQQRDDTIRILQDKVQMLQTNNDAQYQQELKQRDDTIRVLQDKVQTLQTSHDAQQEETKEREDTIQILQDKVQMLQTNNDAQQEEKKEREDTIRVLENKVQTLLSSNNVQQEEKKQWSASVAEREAQLRDEIERLTRALQATATDKEALEQSMTQALETSYAKYKALKSEKETIETELRAVTQRPALKPRSPTTSVVVERNNELEAQVEHLKLSLSKMTCKCQELRAEKSILTKKLKKNELATPRHNDDDNDRTHPPKVFTFGGETLEQHPNTNHEDDLMPHRLERIRDAAERAALAQEHRRELSRLKMEHEKEMKLLSERQEQDIKDVFEEAKAEVTARSRELRRHLQSEYETKIATLERRYQSDLARVHREFDQNTAVAEEAMQAAASEVAAITEQLQMETTARESLQGVIHELELKLVTEQQKNKLSSELVMNRQQWQRDTNNLIETIQQECNTVFTQNLVRRTESPRSVTIIHHNHQSDTNGDQRTMRLDVDKQDEKSSSEHLEEESDLSRIEHGASLTKVAFPVHRTPWKSDRFITKRTTSYQSPLDVSQALDETEALVRSLVAK